MPNAIDLPACTALWSEQDRTLYNRLDFYLAKTQVEYFKNWQVWPKLLKPQKWTPNMGEVMRGVHKDPSPILRGQFIPQKLKDLSKKDVIEIRETKESVELYKHRFESQLMQFQPSFVDFLTDHVDAANKDISEKIVVAGDLFSRTAIFHGSPQVWIPGKAGGELTAAAHWTGSTITAAKNAAVLGALIADIGQAGLNLKNIAKMATVATNDLAIDFFESDILPDKTNGEGLKGKYLLLCGTEVWDMLPFDPYLLQAKGINLDVVTGGFTGSLFGRVTCKFERFPMRIKADGTVPAPETIEENPAAYNFGETVMNPDYVNAPFEVAFLVGAEAYKSVPAGPPPGDFAKGEMGMKAFRSLDWNGKVSQTKDVMVPCLDANNNVVYDTNKYGEYTQLISQATYGILPVRRRNIIPIVYKRARVDASA